VIMRPAALFGMSPSEQAQTVSDLFAEVSRVRDLVVASIKEEEVLPGSICIARGGIEDYEVPWTGLDVDDEEGVMTGGVARLPDGSIAVLLLGFRPDDQDQVDRTVTALAGER